MGNAGGNAVEGNVPGGNVLGGSAIGGGNAAGSALGGGNIMGSSVLGVHTTGSSLTGGGLTGGGGMAPPSGDRWNPRTHKGIPPPLGITPLPPFYNICNTYNTYRTSIILSIDHTLLHILLQL